MILLLACTTVRDAPEPVEPDSGEPVLPAECGALDLEEVATFEQESLPMRDDPSHTVQGVSLGDLDGDGWLDALVAWGGGSFGMRNDGTGNLILDDSLGTEAPLPASEAVALADLDGDGDLDAMLGSWTGNASTYWNDGSGRFSAEEIPGTTIDTFAIAFGDADGDGDLDAYLSAAYTDMTYEEIAAGERVGDPNLLLLQGEDHTFTEAVGALPEETRYGMTLHTAWLDVEGDGDLDLYVGNDAGPYVEPNHLLLNDGRARFTEAEDCACDLPMFTMGVAVGDANQDGLPDLYVTDVGPPELLLNTGGAAFVNATLTAGDAYIPATSTSMVSWGAGFLDLDADADQDLFVTFGQSGKNFDAAGIDGEDGPIQPNELLLSDGAAAYVHAETPAFAAGPRTRAYASGDLDRDGRPDIVTVGKYFLQQFHTTGGCPPGATLQLRGQNVIGAQVDVDVGGAHQTLWHLPSTTSSSNADEVFVGFAGYPSADRIVVTWPGGETTELEDVALGAVLTLDQE
ncbi:hypothetical protein LBMAG42_44460 [Deltaproteobacteria bacterium]|nr:hypothetical protein LBMAG42_44460 [Deltaproteobacteria bacterium]